MLQALVNLFKPFKSKPVEVKVEDTIVPQPVAQEEMGSEKPVVNVEPKPVVKPNKASVKSATSKKPAAIKAVKKKK